MPAHPSKVSDAYAARTPCRKHYHVFPGEARGSMRHHTYSECEMTGPSGASCRYSHDIVNTRRIIALARGGTRPTTVSLIYGCGFERYGSYENWRDGWDVSVDGHDVGHGRGHDLPKFIMLAELKQGVATKGGSDPVYAKKQSMCLQHGSASGCPRGANCPYDHDLIDGKRIQGLAKHNGVQGMTAEDLNYLKVDCVIGPSGDVLWRITMLPEGCKGLLAALQGAVPARPFTFEGAELLDVVRRMETLLQVV
ncbi:hypothetical protein B0H17DRAFT_1231023 [Mycena rosella]|uniref:C3H1-type domain-containing protein n=1 Tax=Mycena rosella TaxID=1033263 RepID=A0AAD7D679_MYCRO|nr:hypothetical protein B0H17DRAFT_1231023 [Mycena rosella]